MIIKLPQPHTAHSCNHGSRWSRTQRAPPGELMQTGDPQSRWGLSLSSQGTVGCQGLRISGRWLVEVVTREDCGGQLVFGKSLRGW